MHLLSFATGNLYRYINEVNLVEFIDKLGVDGIEYTYGKNYGERIITKSDENILLTKKDISMHVPFGFMRKLENIERDTTNFKKMLLDYKRIGAKRLVMHPNQIPSNELLLFGKKQGVGYITENLRKRHGNDKHKNHERLDFETVLNEHKDFGLCLDVSHSYSWSKNETKDIIGKWSDRIKQVHFSVTHYNKGHLGIKSASKSFLESTKCLRDLDVPIVIEEDMNTINPVEIKKEINRVKKIVGLN
jgi:sugar phosphate isomerase/epimerase